MDDNKSFGQQVLARAKAKKQNEPQLKEQSEAERLFQYCFPEASSWKTPSLLLPLDPFSDIAYLKKAALAILGTGIFRENELKCHAGHKKNYPVPLRDLILDLVDRHFKYVDITFFPSDIIKHFDNSFDSMAAFARLAGVTDKKINDVRQDLQKWREKILLAVDQGSFPSNWRELTKVELISSWRYRPRSEAQAFAHVLLGYVPQAPDNRIAIWVNAIIESLGQPPVSISNLRAYINKERKRRPYLHRNSF